jgi:hypothetical protein
LRWPKHSIIEVVEPKEEEEEEEEEGHYTVYSGISIRLHDVILQKSVVVKIGRRISRRPA